MSGIFYPLNCRKKLIIDSGWHGFEPAQENLSEPKSDTVANYTNIQLETLLIN